MAKIGIRLNKSFEYDEIICHDEDLAGFIVYNFFLDKEAYLSLRKKADDWFNIRQDDGDGASEPDRSKGATK